MRRKTKLLWKVFIVVFILIQLLSFFFPYISWLVVHLRYQVSNFLPCHLRYEPLVFLLGENELSQFNVEIRWETSCTSLQYDLLISDNEKKSWRLFSQISKIYPNHAAQVVSANDFEQNKTYYFQLVERNSSNVFGKRFYFNIPQQDSSNVKVGLISDNQMGFVTFRQLLRMLSTKKPQLLYHGGDLVQSAGKVEDWSLQWMDALQVLQSEDGKLIPISFAKGNHDNSNTAYSNHAGRVFAYSQTFGKIRWIFIDSMKRSVEQYDWISKELNSPSSKEATFRIVIVHIPPFIEYWDPEDWLSGAKDWGNWITNTCVPLFESKGVNVVIGGHSHIYQRGKRNSIIYAIVGGGGGILEREEDRIKDWKMYEVTKTENHFVLMNVEGCNLEWQAFNVRGNIIDSFQITSSNCVT